MVDLYGLYMLYVLYELELSKHMIQEDDSELGVEFMNSIFLSLGL